MWNENYFLNVSLGIFEVGCASPLKTRTGLLQGEAKFEICCLEVGQILCVCVCVRVRAYLKSDKVRFHGSAWLGGVRGWKVKGKTVRRESDATFPLAFQQLVQSSYGTLPSDSLFPLSPVHFPSISSFTFTVPKFLELLKHLFLEETLPLPLSILLSPCRRDSFPHFFPKTVEEIFFVTVTEKIPSETPRQLTLLGDWDLQLMAECF